MSFAACAEMVRRGDPDRFLSAMTARPEDRGRLFALYAFNLEVARASWVTSEEMIAEMRLQWWADAVGEVHEGKPARAHEVVGPLAETISAAKLPRELFDGLIEARRFDIYREGHRDRAAFDLYIAATSGNLMQLAALVLGAGDAAMPVVADFAYGAGVANLLRALPRLIEAGHNPLPDDALRDICADAAARIRAARARRGLVTRTARPAMLAGWRASGVLEAVRKRLEEGLEISLETSEFRRRASLIVRDVSGRW